MHSSRTFSFYPYEVVVNLTFFIFKFHKEVLYEKAWEQGENACTDTVTTSFSHVPIIGHDIYENWPPIHSPSNIYNTYYSKLRYHAVNIITLAYFYYDNQMFQLQISSVQCRWDVGWTMVY